MRENLRKLRGQNGNALVLALLLLVTLTSVGVVAVQRTSADINATSAFVRNRQARSAAESGAILATRWMAQTLYQTINKQQDKNTGWTSGAPLAGNLFASSRNAADVESCYSTASTTPEMMLPTLQPGAYSLNIRMLQDVAIDSMAFHRQEKATGMPGTQMNASSGAGLVCQHAYDFTAVAGIPSAAATESCSITLDENSTTGNIILKSRITAVLFPGPCTLR